MKQQNRTSKRTIICFIVIALLFIAALICGIIYFKYMKPYYDAQEMYVNIKEQVVLELPTEPAIVEPDDDTEPDTELQSRDDVSPIDFVALSNMSNGEVFGWLNVPGTVIDYPVMQEQTVGEYQYLWTGIDGRWNGCGSLFVPAKVGNVKDAHTLIFGHQMATKTMFGSLRANFYSYDAAMNNPTAYLYKKDHAERYDIALAATVDMHDDVYQTPYTRNSKDYADMIAHLRDIANYTTNVRLDESRELLVLSTCRAEVSDSARFIAVFVKTTEWHY